MASILGVAYHQWRPERPAQFSGLDHIAEAMHSLELEVLTQFAGEKEAARRGNARKAVDAIQALDRYTSDDDMVAILFELAKLSERMLEAVHSTDRASIADTINEALGRAEEVAS